MIGATLPNKASKLQFIDNLRGVAIIMVIITHADRYFYGLNSNIQNFADYCQMGVQLFFIVSAFTLCMSMEKRDSAKNGLKPFYLRRYFRIAPLYYFGILLYLLYFSILAPVLAGKNIEIADQYTLGNVLANVFMVNDFVLGSGNNQVVPGGWSIGTETTFYAIFPIIYYVYYKYRNNERIIFLIPLIGFVFSLICIFLIEYVANHIINMKDFASFKRNNTVLYFNLVCQLPVFLIGMSLYFNLAAFEKLMPSKRYLLAFPLLGFTILGIFIYNNFETAIVLLAFIPALSFLFLFFLFKNISILNSNILGRIGQLSFSIYIFHFIFAFEGSKFFNNYINVVNPNLLFVLNVFCTLIFTFGVALLSEKFIEKPGILIGKKIISRLKKKNPAYEIAAGV